MTKGGPIKDHNLHNSQDQNSNAKTNWLLICVAVLIAIVVAVKVFGVSISNVVFKVF